MPNNYVHFDLYDDDEFKVVVEKGYLGDCDISIETNDKQLSFRLTDKQTHVLLQKIKQELQ